jgi:hypothetical protein
LLVDLGTWLENFQLIQINHRVLCFKGRVVKTPFWQTSNQGHLAAFKTESNTATRSRFLALVAFSAGFAMPGTLAAAEALNPMLRPRARLQIV